MWRLTAKSIIFLYFLYPLLYVGVLLSKVFLSGKMLDSKEPLHNYVSYSFLYKFHTFLYKGIWYFTDTCRESHFNILLSPFVLLKYFLHTSAIFLTTSNTLLVTQKLRYLCFEENTHDGTDYYLWFVPSVTNLEIIISSTVRLRKCELSQLNFFVCECDIWCNSNVCE